VRLPNVQLEVAGVFTAAALGPGPAPTGGASLALFAGGRWVGGVLGVTGLAPTELALTGARARLIRVPIELAVRGRLILRRWVLTLQLGLVLGAQITEGLDVPASLRQGRLEVGISAGARVEVWATRRLAPFLALAVEGIPVPYDLEIPGTGVVGQTPRLWTSLAIGLAFRAR
jgi:hypothetical protein